MNYFKLNYFSVFTLRAGPQVGPGRLAGRFGDRGGRPQSRPRPGCMPGTSPRGPALWLAEAESEAGHWPEQAGLVAGQAGGQAGVRWSVR